MGTGKGLISGRHGGSFLRTKAYQSSLPLHLSTFSTRYNTNFLTVELQLRRTVHNSFTLSYEVPENECPSLSSVERPRTNEISVAPTLLRRRQDFHSALLAFQATWTPVTGGRPSTML